MNKDLDPALHYTDIPAGCRLSNGLGVCIMVLLALSLYALANLKSASAANRADQLPKGRDTDAGHDSIDRVYYGSAQAPRGALGLSYGRGEDSVNSLVLGPGLDVPTADLGDGDEDDFSALEGSRLLG